MSQLPADVTLNDFWLLSERKVDIKEISFPQGTPFCYFWPQGKWRTGQRAWGTFRMGLGATNRIQGVPLRAPPLHPACAPSSFPQPPHLVWPQPV